MRLAAGDWSADLAPERGGALLRLDWRGEPVLRPACGPGILDVACFPLVPFSNRIAHGRFNFDGRPVTLPANLPDSEEPHAIHGFGWQARWEVIDAAADHAICEHFHERDAWPWQYRARQTIVLSEDGVELTLSLVNESNVEMPGGLGFHPYFPRTSHTLYSGLHRGEWQRGDDGIPATLAKHDAPADWWQGRSIGTRSVDTIYTDRAGPLTISWPEQRRRLVMTPSRELCFTVVYVPDGADFFCVEPVSHLTDAVNRGDADVWRLAPGECREVGLRLAMVEE